MTDIEQMLAEIRRRDSMYPNVELTAGAVADRRTLLNIIDELRDRDARIKAFIREGAPMQLIQQELYKDR